jgi:hypothetical protein
VPHERGNEAARRQAIELILQGNFIPMHRTQLQAELPFFFIEGAARHIVAAMETL